MNGNYTVVTVLSLSNKKIAFPFYSYYMYLFQQPTEKPTVEKSSAAKEPTDPPIKMEHEDEGKKEAVFEGGVGVFSKGKT